MVTVSLFSIETPFELVINDFPLLAPNPEPVTSQPLSLAFVIVFFRNSTHSSRFKSSNFASQIFLTSFTLSTSEKA